MNVVLSWLGQQALLIYLACLIGALAYLFIAISAKRKRDYAQFSLEREVYQRRMSRAGMMAALFLALGGVVFLIRTFVFPTLPATETTAPTPVDVGLFTPTPSPTPTPLLPLTIQSTDNMTATGDVTTTDGVTVPVDATPVVIPTNTPVPTATPIPEADFQPECPSPNAQMTYPLAGSDVSGVVEIQGTADVNAFSYYKFEVLFPGADMPTDIAQYNVPVENGRLGAWDVSNAERYPPGGPYRLRLVVVDIYGNTTVCTIPVNVVAPEEPAEG
jgi:hypothetical protein